MCGLAQDYSLKEFIQELLGGDTQAWIVMGVVVTIMFGLGILHHLTHSESITTAHSGEDHQIG